MVALGLERLPDRGRIYGASSNTRRGGDRRVATNLGRSVEVSQPRDSSTGAPGYSHGRVAFRNVVNSDIPSKFELTTTRLRESVR